MKKFIFIVLLVGFYFTANSQQTIFGYVAPGPNKVGLKIIQTYDYSRTFFSKTVENGNNINNARPIQLLIWYPGNGVGNYLSYKDYLITGLSEVDFSPVTNEQKERFLANHKRVFVNNGANAEKIDSVLNRESYAVRDAEASEGKFPLIIYSPGGNERCFENFILCEYLASHGYIVAAIALTGQESQLMAFESNDYETSVDDISFVISYMRNFPNVDNSKLGLIGFCYGSMINTMVANRNSNVDVMVDLYGAINSKETREDVDPAAFHYLKNPGLAYIQLAGSAEERDSYFIENYLYGDVYQARFSNVSHNAFTSNYVSRNHYFKDKLPNGHNVAYADTVDACYKNVCRYTLEMVNAYVKNIQTSIEFLNREPSENAMANLIYFKRKAAPAPPTPDQFIKIARTQGVAKAKQIYNDVRSTDKYWKLFKENQMNVLGYQLLGSGNIDDAIEVFTLISLEYPNSWNAFDSLGEACLKKGNNELAKKYLEKSVELFSQNTHAIELLKQI